MPEGGGRGGIEEKQAPKAEMDASLLKGEGRGHRHLHAMVLESRQL